MNTDTSFCMWFVIQQRKKLIKRKYLRSISFFFWGGDGNAQLFCGFGRTFSANPLSGLCKRRSGHNEEDSGTCALSWRNLPFRDCGERSRKREKEERREGKGREGRGKEEEEEERERREGREEEKGRGRESGGGENCCCRTDDFIDDNGTDGAGGV